VVERVSSPIDATVHAISVAPKVELISLIIRREIEEPGIMS
jgi:hypothetical protein